MKSASAGILARTRVAAAPVLDALAVADVEVALEDPPRELLVVPVATLLL